MRKPSFSTAVLSSGVNDSGGFLGSKAYLQLLTDAEEVKRLQKPRQISRLATFTVFRKDAVFQEQMDVHSPLSMGLHALLKHGEEVREQSTMRLLDLSETPTDLGLTKHSQLLITRRKRDKANQQELSLQLCVKLDGKIESVEAWPSDRVKRILSMLDLSPSEETLLDADDQPMSLLPTLEELGVKSGDRFTVVHSR